MKELRKACLMALWFMKSEEKRVALAKALASGKKKDIVTVAKKSVNSVRDPKTRKQLSQILFSVDSKNK